MLIIILNELSILPLSKNVETKSKLGEYSQNPKLSIIPNYQDGTDLALFIQKTSQNIELPKPSLPRQNTAKKQIPANTTSDDFITYLSTDTLEAIKAVVVEKLSSYYFYYGDLPEIYTNKSKALLTEKASDAIYFYMDKGTNAMGIVLTDIPENHGFRKVSLCPQTVSPDMIDFIYKGFEISFCLDGGKVDTYWITH